MAYWVRNRVHNADPVEEDSMTRRPGFTLIELLVAIASCDGHVKWMRPNGVPPQYWDPLR